MLGFGVIGEYTLGQITGNVIWWDNQEESETWTERTAQAETWTQVTRQAETWTEV